MHHVDVPILYVLRNELSGAKESFLDVGAGLGGRLDEQETILLGKLCGFFVADVNLGVKILLVAYEHDDSVGICEVSSVRQPRCQVMEGGATVRGRDEGQ